MKPVSYKIYHFLDLAAEMKKKIHDDPTENSNLIAWSARLDAYNRAIYHLIDLLAQELEADKNHKLPDDLVKCAKNLTRLTLLAEICDGRFFDKL